MKDVIVAVLFAVALSFNFAALSFRIRNGTFTGPGDGCGAVANALSCVAFGVLGWWPLAAVSGVMAAWCAWDWWRNRRKGRRRAARLAGYKARAALARLAQRAREAARPRPVLRPVPQGGGA